MPSSVARPVRNGRLGEIARGHGASVLKVGAAPALRGPTRELTIGSALGLHGRRHHAHDLATEPEPDAEATDERVRDVHT